MKNVMYKIIMGCYIVAALVLVTACNDNLDIQQAYPFSIETLPVPKRLKVGETAEIRCPTGAWRLLPADYLSDTVFPAGRQRKAGKWITARCSCPMTSTRWRKKRSGSTTPRHRPTSRRLTFISSTASGRCSNLHYHLIMITAKKERKQ